MLGAEEEEDEDDNSGNSNNDSASVNASGSASGSASGKANKSSPNPAKKGNKVGIIGSYAKCLKNRTPVQRKKYCKDQFEALPGLRKKCEVNYFFYYLE